MLAINMKKSIINGFAFVSLLIAFYIGQADMIKPKQLHQPALFETYNIDRVDKGSRVYSGDKWLGYISEGWAQGYGGRLKVMVLSDSLGRLIDMDLMHHTETHAYVAKLRNKRFFEQFPDKKLNDKFLIREDVEAISGATVSSNAIALASREASWKLATDQFSFPLPDIEAEWQLAYQDLWVALIFILGIVAVLFKKKKLRYAVLFSSFILIGFVLNASVSLSHIAKVLLGYMPDIRQHFVWYVLLLGNIFTILVLGRNVYCNTVCPFHAGQIILNKISGINFKLAPKLSRFLIHTPKYLLYLSLILILISENPTLASYEPFAMFFSLEGIGVQWYILPAALIGSLFISDFFCHYFCPVGASFKVLLDARRWFTNKILKSDG